MLYFMNIFPGADFFGFNGLLNFFVAETFFGWVFELISNSSRVNPGPSTLK